MANCNCADSAKNSLRHLTDELDETHFKLEQDFIKTRADLKEMMHKHNEIPDEEREHLLNLLAQAVHSDEEFMKFLRDLKDSLNDKRIVALECMRLEVPKPTKHCDSGVGLSSEFDGSKSNLDGEPVIDERNQSVDEHDETTPVCTWEDQDDADVFEEQEFQSNVLRRYSRVNSISAWTQTDISIVEALETISCACGDLRRFSTNQ